MRRPVVAGSFYPGRAGALAKAVADCIGERRPAPAVGGIVPHAGYIYSGPTAGAFFAAVEVPDRVVLLGPKHTYRGSDYAVWPAGSWETPLGETVADEELAQAVLSRCPSLEADEGAHIEEHSLEVILPFVQLVNPKAKVVPIALGPLPPPLISEFGSGIADAITDAPDGALIVVSSDMSHYVSSGEAERLDRLALVEIERLDADGLVETVQKNHITMCGVWPTAVGITAARALGAKNGKVVKYTNSGETSGDYNQVVGYAAVVFE